MVGDDPSAVGTAAIGLVVLFAGGVPLGPGNGADPVPGHGGGKIIRPMGDTGSPVTLGVILNGGGLILGLGVITAGIIPPADARISSSEKLMTSTVIGGMGTTTLTVVAV